MRYNKFIICCFLFIGCSCTEDVDPKLAFEQGDYERVFPIWQRRASENDLDAQNFLGTHYLLGLGVKRDFALARKWYEKAARDGHPDAQRNLGLMYEAGHGLPRNFEQAYLWLYAAHRQGHPRASATIPSLVIKLSPNNMVLLRGEARQYIFNDVRGEDEQLDNWIVDP